MAMSEGEMAACVDGLLTTVAPWVFRGGPVFCHASDAGWIHNHGYTVFRGVAVKSHPDRNVCGGMSVVA